MIVNILCISELAYKVVGGLSGLVFAGLILLAIWIKKHKEPTANNTIARNTNPENKKQKRKKNNHKDTADEQDSTDTLDESIVDEQE